MDSGKSRVYLQPVSHAQASMGELARPDQVRPPNFDLHSHHSKDSMYFASFWRIFLKRKWTVIATAIIVFTLAAIATFRMTPMYDAVARVAINREGPDMLGFKDSGSRTATDDEDYTVKIDTESRILQSDAMALQIISSLNLENNPDFTGKRANNKSQPASMMSPLQPDSKREAELISNFKRSLSVTKVFHTRLIEIHFLNRNPKLAAEVANAVSNAYIEQNFKTKFASTMQASDWIAQQLADLQLKVQTSEEKLVRYQRENGIIGLDEKQNIITSKLSQLNLDATTAQSERIQKEANYKTAMAGNPELVSKLDSEGMVEKLRARESELSAQLAKLSVMFGPSYPRVMELNSQLKQTREEMKAESARVAQRYKSEFGAARERETMLTRALESQKQEANQLNERSIEFNILKHDADSNRQLYDGLLARMKEAGVSAGLRSNNIRIVDTARVPVRPAKPNVPLNLSLGLLLGLIGGVALAFALENLDNTVISPDQVRAVSSLPLLGIIPLNAASKNGAALNTRAQKGLPSGDQSTRLVSLSRPKSEVAESYRALRTSILLSSVGAPPKVIMVTSGLPQEGKTTTSINTAIVLAQKGGRILLVDADLRRPTVHQTFGISGKQGLSTLLTGSDAEPEIVPAPGVPGLFLLAAGPVPPHPAELLGSSIMSQYLMRWRDEFDHVVIDTPPILSVTDAVVLSVEVDAVVLVVHSGKTNKDALRRSRELLLQVNSRLMGVILNAVDLQSPDSYHYYYGSKYRGYYYEETAEKL